MMKDADRDRCARKVKDSQHPAALREAVEECVRLKQATLAEVGQAAVAANGVAPVEGQADPPDPEDMTPLPAPSPEEGGVQATLETFRQHRRQDLRRLQRVLARLRVRPVPDPEGA
jgi:hypothetical protein